MQSSSSGRTLLSGALVALALASSALLSPETTLGREPSRQAFDASLTSVLPGSSSGLEQTIEYTNPADPGGKPPAVERILFELPAGSHIDTAVPRRCAASDQELQARGAAACPPETRVGSGTLSADTGAEAEPRVIETDVQFFNSERELILFAESTNTPGPALRVVSRVAVGDSTLLSTVPPLPGAPPPDPFLAIKKVFNRLDATPRAGAEGGAAFIRTPPSCPKAGNWTITATFTYRDGIEQTERSATPCAASPTEARCLNPLLGSAGSDVFSGGAGGDAFWGRGGGDQISGHAGPDCLHGNRGADRVAGSRGSDILRGGRGLDSLRGGPGVDRIKAGRGSDTANGGGGDDRLAGGRGRDHLRGAGGADRISGGRGADQIRAGSGSDRIDVVGGGRDEVRCGGGRDTVLASPNDGVGHGCELTKRR